MAHPHTHIACSGPHIHLLLGSGRCKLGDASTAGRYPGSYACTPTCAPSPTQTKHHARPQPLTICTIKTCESNTPAAPCAPSLPVGL
eukprot:scaffold316139_cov19-Tisochrysis_lutea.AAC.1